MRHRRTFAALGAFAIAVPLAVLSAAPANAESSAEPQTLQTCGAVFHTGDDFRVGSSSWPSAANVDKFDPALGTLVSIDISGVVRDGGFVGFENTANRQPSGSFGYGWNANLTTSFGDTYELEATYDGAFPNTWNRADEVAALGPFDGTVDYAGTSGRTLSPAEKTFSASYTADDPMASSFIGTDALELFSPRSGIITGGTYSGLSTQHEATLGPGLLVTPESEDGAVGPSACVTYTYIPTDVTPPTPTPTPTPTPVTPEPTTTPTSEPTPAPSPSATPSVGELATTGYDPRTTLGVAAALLALGGAVALTSRFTKRQL